MDYAAKNRSVTAILKKYGAAATLKRVTTGAYSAATGSSALTEVSSSVYAAVFDYPEKLIDGSLIKVGDKKAYVSSAGAAPKTGDILTWQSVDYIIHNPKDLAPAGVSVLFELQLRK